MPLLIAYLCGGGGDFSSGSNTQPAMTFVYCDNCPNRCSVSAFICKKSLITTTVLPGRIFFDTRVNAEFKLCADETARQGCSTSANCLSKGKTPRSPFC